MSERIFHADDWGMSPAINQGILALARRGQLRSASCMADAPYLECALDELIKQAGVELYLHLDLTYGPGRIGHKELLWRSWCGQVDKGETEFEIDRQFGSLEAKGVRVAGVNGHHHVHLLPGVVEPLMQVMVRRSIRRLLVVDDADHLWSRLQTRLFTRRHPSIPEPLLLERCDYLRPSHLKSRARLLRKVENAKSKNFPLLVHPALWDDFLESGMTDSLRGHRIVELKTIIKHLHAQ